MEWNLYWLVDMPSEYQNCKVFTGIELKFMPSSGHSNKPNNVKYGVSLSVGGLQPHNQL